MTRTALILLATNLLAVGAASAQETAVKPIGIVLAAGDITGCTKDRRNDDKTAAILRREVAQATDAGVPIKILVLGDLAYPKGSTTSFDCFREQWGDAELLPHLLPVPGNHDVGEGNIEPYYDFFKDNALVQSNGKHAGYYALNFPDAATGPWRLMGLNPYAGYGSGSPQMKWINEDLKTSKTPCVLAFTHPFILSSGLHGHNDKTKKKNGKKAFTAKTIQLSSGIKLFSALYPHGVSLYVAGHDHSFEQFRRHDVKGDAAPDGIRSFVVGTGGHPLYQEPYKFQAPGQEHYDDKNFGVLKIKLGPDRYDWEFLAADEKPYPPLKPSGDICNARKSP